MIRDRKLNLFCSCDSTTVTSCMLGDFKNDARTRNEFLHLVRSAPYAHVAGPAMSEQLSYSKRTRMYESDGVHLERSLEVSLMSSIPGAQQWLNVGCCLRRGIGRMTLNVGCCLCRGIGRMTSCSEGTRAREVRFAGEMPVEMPFLSHEIHDHDGDLGLREVSKGGDKSRCLPAVQCRLKCRVKSRVKTVRTCKVASY